MRPKKTVLLCCADPDRQSMTAFILRCHGYRTVPFGAEAENADCALIVWKEAILPLLQVE
jgi:hypothetical protein